jgi:hypothetical protein
MTKWFEPGRYQAEVIRSFADNIPEKGTGNERIVLKIEFEVIFSENGHDLPAPNYPPNLVLWMHKDSSQAISIMQLRMMGCEAPTLEAAMERDALKGLIFEVDCVENDSDYDRWEIPLPPKEKSESTVDTRTLKHISSVNAKKWQASQALLEKRKPLNGRAPKPEVADHVIPF